jgi:beta propeller repeat protein
LENALNYAESKGVILIASAGNDYSNRIKYPAGYDNVIAVASSNICDDKASYSNYGSWVDVVAPGGDNTKKCNFEILSTVPRVGGKNADISGYKALKGTSMACPYIAGVAALIKSQYPETAASEIRSRILVGTDNISGIFHSSALLGSGLINVNKALTISEQAYCMLRKFNTIDLNGDENIRLTPNCKTHLIVEVENIWASVSDVSVEIQLHAPEINLSHTTVNFGAMGSGQKKDNSADPITIDIGEVDFEGFEKSFPVNVLLLFDGETIAINKTLVVGKDFQIVRNYEKSGAGHDISGHSIVYSEYKSDENRIRTRLYNTITDQITVVSKFDGYDGRSKFSYLPRISMQKVVWCDTRNGKLFGDDIYMYDLLTNTESAVDINTGLQYYPEISGDQIVWTSVTDPMDPDFNFNIHSLNTSTGKQNIICDNPFFQTQPAVYGNNIAWFDSRLMGGTSTPTHNPEIYLFNGTQQTPVVTVNSQKSYLKMSGNHLVWADNRNGNSDIYMYNIATGVETPVCVNSAEQRAPEIFGDRIVWTDFRQNGVFCDVYMYTISTGKEIALTTNPLVSQGAARISAGKICWLETINGKYEIRYTELENYNIGDVNGNSRVDILDALSISRYIKDYEQYNEFQWENADVSVDGYVSIHDARIVAEYYVGNLEKVKNQLVIGDIDSDGDVDTDDFYICEAVVSGKDALNTLQNIACDVNGDNSISVSDLQLIYLYANNSISEFPFVKK